MCVIATVAVTVAITVAATVAVTVAVTVAITVTVTHTKMRFPHFPQCVVDNVHVHFFFLSTLYSHKKIKKTLRIKARLIVLKMTVFAF